MEKVKYPENLHLKELIKQSGMNVKFLAKKIGVSREVLSRCVNGHYKGEKTIVSALMNDLEQSN